MKSGGVPGFTVGLTRPSWCECISVSSKSNTNIFFCTVLNLYVDAGDNGHITYLTDWCWITLLNQ